MSGGSARPPTAIGRFITLKPHATFKETKTGIDKRREIRLSVMSASEPREPMTRDYAFPSLR